MTDKQRDSANHDVPTLLCTTIGTHRNALASTMEQNMAKKAKERT